VRSWVIACLTIALVLALAGTAQALYIKEKPSVVVSIAGSNHLKKGENVITLIAYNPAKNKRIIYDDTSQAMFFKGKEYMLFTAYNVSFELEGNDFIEVKTPKQMIPALKPMNPIQLRFIVKVKDDAKAGEYELKLKVHYEIIKCADIDFGVIQQQVPTYYNISGNNSQYGEVYESEFVQYLDELYIDYDDKELTIPLKVYVEEEDVRLEILSVEAKDFQAKGKGLLTIKVKNIGEKIGKNAFLVLETPSGFSVESKMPSTGMPTPTMPTMPMSPMAMGMQAPMQPTAMQTTSLASLSKSNAIFVGDLMPNGIAEATFPVKISVKDAGNYTFEVKAVYLDEYGNIKESKPVPFGVYVEPAPSFKAVSVESKVFVNTKGDVIVTISADKAVKEASAILKVSPPLSALSSECYLGDLKPNECKVAVFKIKASNEAKPVVYPADVIVKYKVSNEWVESDPIRIGIKVNPKIEFEIIGTPEIAQGEEKIITVTIKNAGNFTIREATARVIITDPFTSTDDSAYIGTLKPGETRDISFKIKVDKDATPKVYGLNVEVKYKDPEGEWAISEPTKMVVKVTPFKPPTLTFLAIGAIAVIAIAAYLLRRRWK